MKKRIHDLQPRRNESVIVIKKDTIVRRNTIADIGTHGKKRRRTPLPTIAEIIKQSIADQQAALLPDVPDMMFPEEREQPRIMTTLVSSSPLPATIMTAQQPQTIRMSAPSLVPVPDAAPAEQEQASDMIAWSAPEFEQNTQPYWYALPVIAEIILITIGIIIKNYYFVFFLLLAGFVLFLYTQKGARMISFAVSINGVKVGKTLYSFQDIKSFWIFEKPGVRDLSIETVKTLSPYVRLPLGGADAIRIRSFLTRFIPERQHEEFAMDEITRMLGI